jgi:hypothetical protein
MTLIRTILFALVLAVATTGAFGEIADRDILLTSEGVLYTVESRSPEGLDLETNSGRILLLTILRGSEAETTAVPASLYGGMHANPGLAWDHESKSLFVVWQKTPMPQMTSDLLFSSYQNGRWSEPTLINQAGFEIRKNLRLATTRYYFERRADGTMTRKPGLVLHVVWWTETGRGENAGYAMIRMENGAVKSIRNVTLPQLLGEEAALAHPVELPFDFNRELLRHPTITDNAAHDAVDITFADWNSDMFQNVTIRPITDDGVLDPPIGVWGGGFRPPGSFHRNIEPGSAISVLTNADRSKLLFHYRNGAAVEFLSVDTNTSTWSELRSVTTSEKLSLEAAVEALRRMIAAE